MLTRVNDTTVLTDNTYHWGKKLVQLWIPALTTLYLGLGQVWSFPAIDKVTASSACICTFLGAILQISSSNYDKSGAGVDGQLVLQRQDDGDIKPRLEADLDVDELMEKDKITFEVDKRGPRPPVRVRKRPLDIDDVED